MEITELPRGGPWNFGDELWTKPIFQTLKVEGSRLLLEKAHETQDTYPRLQTPRSPASASLSSDMLGTTAESQGSTGGNPTKPTEKNKGVKGI